MLLGEMVGRRLALSANWYAAIIASHAHKLNPDLHNSYVITNTQRVLSGG